MSKRRFYLTTAIAYTNASPHIGFALELMYADVIARDRRLRGDEVLRLAGEGQSAGDMAKQLNLSQGTVRNYLSEAIGKLGVANRIEAYRLARQRGWL